MSVFTLWFDMSNQVSGHLKACVFISHHLTQSDLCVDQYYAMHSPAHWWNNITQFLFTLVYLQLVGHL